MHISAVSVESRRGFEPLVTEITGGHEMPDVGARYCHLQKPLYSFNS